MNTLKGILFVCLVAALALGVFNGVFVAVSAYFGPFYASDADQNRNFGLWLLGNGLVAVVSVVLGVRVYRRRRGRLLLR